jgi:proteic killer suppression protein
MIDGFQHKGLRLFFENDDSSKLQPPHVEKIRRILYRLDEAEKIEDMDVVGWALHQLSGNLKGFWSVKVNGNFRIIFRFENGYAYDVNYLDYH